MGFKEEGARFTKDIRFRDYALDFAAGEASRFSTGESEDASAKVDLTLSRAAALSASKHKNEAKEMKRFLKTRQKEAFTDNAKSECREFIGERSENNNSEKSESTYRTDDEPHTEYSERSERAESPENGGNTGNAEIKSDSGNEGSGEPSKKTVSKEKRKAASKTAVAKMLRAKGLMGNDLGTDRSSGDAFKDGNTGAVRAVTEILNPATYLKGFFVKIAVAVVPHMIMILMFLINLKILVTLVAGMFYSINSVSANVSGIMEQYTGRGRILSEHSLTDEEIEEIVSESGATGRQEAVIRFALSRVGYPYSQARRTSGSAYDCSSLAYYSWLAAGVDLSYGGGYPPTAAAEASKLQSKGTVVNSTRLNLNEMQPGDLVFYGGHDNGRFLGIYHVAVYIGNGEVVEALNPSHGVVHQTLRTKNVILVLRP